MTIVYIIWKDGSEEYLKYAIFYVIAIKLGGTFVESWLIFVDVILKKQIATKYSRISSLIHKSLEKSF